MCGSMADNQSAMAEIRRGKKRRRKKEEETRGQKYDGFALFHRATITKELYNTTQPNEKHRHTFVHTA